MSSAHPALILAVIVAVLIFIFTMPLPDCVLITEAITTPEPHVQDISSNAVLFVASCARLGRSPTPDLTSQKMVT